jgi:hypothetical protein
VSASIDAEYVKPTLDALATQAVKSLADVIGMTHDDLDSALQATLPGLRKKLRDALRPHTAPPPPPGGSQTPGASRNRFSYLSLTGYALAPNEQPIFKSPYPHPTAPFVEIRKSGVWFADRTQYLKIIDDDFFPNFAIMRRPPRMGKSFMLRVLDIYYDIDCPPEVFSFCFNNLNIHGHPPKKKHMMLMIDFATLKDGPFTTTNIEYTVRVSLEFFVQRYATRLGDTSTLFSVDTRKSLRNILQRVGDIGETVFLLIDEIDAGASWMITELLNDLPTSSDLMQASSIFGLVKEQQYSQILVRGFASGITTLQIKELLSMSVWRDISLEERYHLMYGLCEAEIQSLIDRYAVNHTSELKAEFMKFLRETQDGYRFTTNQTEPSVYNTTLALKITTAFITQDIPWQMIDTTDIVPHAVLRLMKKLPTVTRLAKSMLVEPDWQIPETAESIDAVVNLGQYIESISSLQDVAVCMRFLFSVGFLSIHMEKVVNACSVRLQIPNSDVANLIQNTITELEYSVIEQGLIRFKNATLGLCSGAIDKFTEFVEQTTLASLNTYYDAGTMEQAWKVCVLPHITWFTAYRVDSEWSTTSGRIDIWAELVSSVRQKIPELMDLVIELKRLPLSSLSFHSGRHPASHELSNMTSEALRKTLDVTYFAPKTSLIMFEQDALEQCTRYARRMIARQAQQYRVLRITLIFLGTVRILGSCTPMN